MGCGKNSDEWPSPPPPEVKFGYAGGLGDHNIAAQLTRIEATAPGRTLWVDMESSLRTTLKDERDIFDCNKAMACVRHVIEMGLKPSVGS